MRNFFYPETDSTNHRARQLLVTEAPSLPFWVSTGFQSKGRGYGVNRWESQRDQNITATLVYPFRNLPAAGQFVVSQAVSLGLIDFLDLFVSGSKIKWPNDIYLKDRKIAGLLIENDVSGELVSLSVIGMGININQTAFSDDIKNPVSLSLITGYQYDLTELMNLLENRLVNRLEELDSGNHDSLAEDYLTNMYRYKQYFPYRAEGDWFEARITGLGPFGELRLETKAGRERIFGFKEVEFIL